MSAVIHEPPFAAINRAVLDTILRAYSQRDHETLTSLGISAEVARDLSQMSSQALHSLSCYRGLLPELQVADQQIAGLIREFSMTTDQSEQLNELIRLGASLPMMSALARMHITEFKRRRRLVGIAGHDNGKNHVKQKQRFRPRNLTVEETEQCGRSWLKHKDRTPIERYIFVAKDTGLDLASVWQELRSDDT